jgi:hypothetical protein
MELWCRRPAVPGRCPVCFLAQIVLTTITATRKMSGL